MLQELKSFDPAKYSVDELVALSVYAGNLAGAYPKLELEIPSWLTDAQDLIGREIQARSRDQLEKELRETEARLEQLKSRDERVRELKEKQDRLRARLNK